METLLASTEKFPLPFLDPLCVGDSPDWMLPELQVWSPRGPVQMLSMSRPTSQSTQTITPTQAGSAALTGHKSQGWC